MRAVVVTRPGGPEVLQVADVSLPVPGPDEVRVRVRAFGVNRADLLQRRGLYPAPADSPQDIPGLEYAGEVDALGDDVTGLALGERVMGIVGGGSYAEQVLAPAMHVVPIPERLSFPEAAAVPEAFITAHDALERLGVAANEWVLVHAVGSGVGTAAVQLIAARGGRTIGTSRTAAKLERARELGLEVGIDTAAEDLVAAVRAVVTDGVAAVLDLVGGRLFATTLQVLALKGRLVLVGITAGRHAEVDLGVILRRRLRIEGTVLRSRSFAEKSDVTRSFRSVVLPLFAQARIRPVLDRTFPFAETAAAHAYMESNASFGKIVVEVA